VGRFYLYTLYSLVNHRRFRLITQQLLQIQSRKLTWHTLSTRNVFWGGLDFASSSVDHTDSSNAWRLAHEEEDSSRGRTRPEYTGDDTHWGCAANRQQK